ncbi:TPA: glycosyltransferase [Morganella morganii]|nr:glycosyltransferase [Morganella morganii]
MKRGKVDVSVIIPVFNAEKTLPILIEKLLMEESVNFEVIIIDDGSTDNTNAYLKSITDDRVIFIEQQNKGVYAARNRALDMHKGRWVTFIDADDVVENNFIYERYIISEKANSDVVIFNGNRSNNAEVNIARPIHKKQSYDKKITGHQWIDSCVRNKEWPHYLWLQMIKSDYIKKNTLSFMPGYSHKDITWTIDLALKNGYFYISSHCDYWYIMNVTSITKRSDYFDKRAQSYIEVVSYIISCAKNQQSEKLKSRLLCHALFETRHFLGLLRKKVVNVNLICTEFNRSIELKCLFKGIRNLSDLLFFLKLVSKTAKLGLPDNNNVPQIKK